MNTQVQHKVETTSQVIGARITKDQWHQLERKCLEKQIPMSQILQQAVADFLKS